MVDPNPARGMPLALKRYWLAGKGAAKIRWGAPGDFNRCVRALRKHFPKEPEGLCNILHTQALGAPPGKGHGEHAVEQDRAALVAATQLMARQPLLGKHLWAGPLAPIGRLTGEPQRMRQFEPGALRHRTLPLPLSYRKVSAEGHAGSVVTARILGVTYGPGHDGADWAWGWGDYLDEDIIPEAQQARYMVDQGVMGPSLDPGGKVVGVRDPATGIDHMAEYTMGGATLVSIPAFSDMRLYNLSEEGDWDDDDPDMDPSYAGGGEPGCGCGDGLTATVGEGHVFTVNPSGWRGLPLAPRDSVFDNDDAVKRIAADAGVGSATPDVDKLRRAFMYHDSRMPETNTTSYRLPVGDIINGKLTLIYHAIYAAAALISGAHGGLPNVPEEDKNQLRNVITDIYGVMAEEFGDPSVKAPWDRPEREGQRFAMTETEYPVAPPVTWFEDPGLSAETKLTVTPEGRVFGHLAAWDKCHRDVSMRSCVLAPRSQQEYVPFHLGNVIASNGVRISVGKIVMDTRHADIRHGYSAAALHYDNTGDEIAIVRAGEDQFGIWVAGALVPEATPRKVAKLRRSPLSGDWRRVDGHLELTAALAVNVPAFPVYAMEGEQQTALVAAGTVYPELDDEEDDDMAEDVAEDIAPRPTFSAEALLTLIRGVVADELAADQEQEDLAWELRDLIEADQQVLAAELESLVAADDH